MVQLENEFRKNPSFTLQKLWYYIHPSYATLQSSAEICLTIHNVTKLYTSTLSSRAPSLMDITKLTLSTSLGSLTDSFGTFGFRPKSISSFQLNDPSVSPWYYKGGGLLGMLSTRYLATSGDPSCKKLHQFLLHSASQPYLEVLRKWIHLGKLEDPYDEFMVIEKDLKKTGLAEDFNDQYWEQRYKIRQEAVPTFLAPYAEKILLTGKYLNVYIECGEAVSAQEANPDELAPGAEVLNELCIIIDGKGRYVSEIEAAYRLSNKLLLGYLLEKQLLLERLKSIKHFFLLDQSDFIDHFLDSAHEELSKPWQQASVAKLQSLLDIAIRNPASVSCRDPFKEDLKVGMEDVPLFDQLLGILGVSVDTAGTQADLVAHAAQHANNTMSANNSIITTSGNGKMHSAIHALIFWYQVDFPLSLMFSRRAIVKYQMIFRNLMLIKHMERQLSESWMLHAQVALRQQVVSRRPNTEDSPGMVLLYRISIRLSHTRMRMLALVESLGYYLTHDVIEPHHQSLERRLLRAETVDDVLNYLHDFLGTCIKESFMSNSKLIRVRYYISIPFFVIL
jgi:gamma-tubulin complex component 2